MERVDIKDVILPFELQKAMAAEAEGTRVGKAKVIEAEGEIKAAENLREASRIMMENPQTMLLRYLQTLSFIAGQQKTSIVFPFPLELPEPESMKNARRPTV
ncbi:erythrocyte band 7 integral membrane protein-like [Ostrinia furnacalis]|nr:erythrocyte band 7 integral membrane protein-like [Ostrinia furnacalis]